MKKQLQFMETGAIDMMVIYTNENTAYVYAETENENFRNEKCVLANIETFKNDMFDFDNWTLIADMDVEFFQNNSECKIFTAEEWLSKINDK